MKGRPPTPVETKRATGNPGGRALPEPVRVSDRVLADEEGATDAQLDVIESQLPVPPHLATDGEAVELWRTYGEMLARGGIIEVSDALALEALIEAELMARRTWQQMHLERSAAGGSGATYEGTSGALTRHPAFTVWRDSRATFLRYAEQLGLTPAARTRLGVLGLAGQKLRNELDDALPQNPVNRGGSSS